MPKEVCRHDSCEMPGICDGRHCHLADGAVRLSPKEQAREDQRAALRAAIAVLTPPDGSSGDDRFTLTVSEARGALGVLVARLSELDPHTGLDG